MPVPSAVQNLPGLGATGATGSYTLLVLVIPGTVALGILAAASLARISIMSSFFCCCQTIKPGIGRVFAGDPVEIIRLVLFVSVYMPQHRSLLQWL
jgi:hypothetical protein